MPLEQPLRLFHGEDFGVLFGRREANYWKTRHLRELSSETSPGGRGEPDLSFGRFVPNPVVDPGTALLTS